MKKSDCERMKYAQVWHAMRDYEEGINLYTRKSHDYLVQIDSASDIVRYFYDLYIKT